MDVYLKNISKKALSLISGNDWEAAHELVQDNSDKLSCIIHAYLHRKEGDTSNAAYWYRLAGEKFPDISLREEFLRLEVKVNA
jgi:hypothetical protein